MSEKLFPYEGVATKKSFVGRSVEQKEVMQHIHNSTNLVLFSKRRMGKSSLLQYCLETNLDSSYIKIFIDVFDITSEEDFARALLEGISAHKKIDVKKLPEVLKWVSTVFNKVKFEPSFDTTTGSVGLKVVSTHLTFEEMMKEAFESLYSLSKNKKIVLVIDEFQQVSTIKTKKIDATFRSFMQKDNNAISYIFMGSKRHMLLELFKYKAPLYEQATPMELKPLNSNDFFAYASKHLKISQETINKIFEIADGETKLIQHICHILHRDHKRKEITLELIQEAIAEIISSKESMFRLVFNNFSLNQKKAIKILGKYGKKVMSNEVLVEYDVKKYSLNSAFQQLFAQEYIDKEDDTYFIPDRSFELWCSRM